MCQCRHIYLCISQLSKIIFSFTQKWISGNSQLWWSCEILEKSRRERHRLCKALPQSSGYVCGYLHCCLLCAFLSEHLHLHICASSMLICILRKLLFYFKDYNSFWNYRLYADGVYSVMFTIELLDCHWRRYLFSSKTFASFPSGAVNDLAMSANGELCCTVSDDKTAKVFDVINFGKP